MSGGRFGWLKRLRAQFRPGYSQKLSRRKPDQLVTITSGQNAAMKIDVDRQGETLKSDPK